MRASGFVIAASFLSLAGCSDLADLRGPTAWGQLDKTPPKTSPSGLAHEVSGGAALASLPSTAGAVVSVDERREEKGWVQTVTLASEPSARRPNSIEIAALPRGHEVASRISQETIEKLLAEELPDVDMRIRPAPVEAATGPMAVAAGRAADGTRCVYGFQNFATGAENEGFSRILAYDRPAYSVRVRLCRHGVSEEQLIAQVQGLRVRSDLTTRRTSTATASLGSDALASAGYVGTVAPTPVAAVPVVSPTPVPVVPVAPKAPAHADVASAPGTETKSARLTAAPTPAIVADPIPLPSGG